MTDVTGFGVAGHLLEMLSGSQLQATVYAKRIPILPGAKLLFEQGLSSSLQSDNLLAADKVFTKDRVQNSVQLNLLVDPQTSGGLLAAVPRESAAPCLDELLNAGYTASIIGELSAPKGVFPIILECEKANISPN
jgi:selenide,water dikinase